MDFKDELCRRRRQRRRQELERQVEQAKQELAAWLQEYFRRHPAPSRSYQALVLAELYRLAEDPAYLWLTRQPLAFMGEVLATVQQEVQAVTRGIAEALLEPPGG